MAIFCLPAWAASFPFLLGLAIPASVSPACLLCQRRLSPCHLLGPGLLLSSVRNTGTRPLGPGLSARGVCAPAAIEGSLTFHLSLLVFVQMQYPEIRLRIKVYQILQWVPIPTPSGTDMQTDLFCKLAGAGEKHFPSCPSWCMTDGALSFAWAALLRGSC